MITIYTQRECPYCEKAKQWLDTLNLEYQEVDLGDTVTKHEFIRLYPHLKTVPQIFSGNKHIGGYKELIDTDPKLI